MNDHYFPIEPKDGVTHLVVSVSHNKDRKRVFASVYPAESTGKGMYTIVITAGKYATLEPMARLNRKRLEALTADALRQVKEKSGPVFDVVNALCAEQGYKLV